MFVPRTLKHIVPSALALSVAVNSGAATPPSEPTTVVLVHGAFADSSSWNGVVPKLQAHGLRVVGAANPLRSVSGDAAYVGRLLDRISGPVVLVGHSYGGAVISQAATGHSNVKALVHVAAFVPDAGETALGLAWKFPGGTLNDALAEPVTLPGGGKEHAVMVSEPDAVAALIAEAAQSH